MSDRLTEHELTETLDRNGHLDAARGPGVYALDLAVSRDRIATYRRRSDAVPSGLSTLVACDRLVYVGESRTVYSRLCDHVSGRVRQANPTGAFPPVDVGDVWPVEDEDRLPVAEFNRAHEIAGNGTAVWVNGVLL